MMTQPDLLKSKHSRIRALLSVASVIGFWLFSHAAAAADYKLQWFDTEGHVVDVNWNVSGHWVWKDGLPNSPAVLTHEISIQFPANIKVVDTFNNPDVRVLTPSEKSDQGQTLVLSARSLSPNAKLDVDFGDGKKTDRGGISVAIADEEAPHLLVHASCSRLGMDLDEVQNQGIAPFFVGISCMREKGDVFIRFQYPDGFVLRDELDPSTPLDSIRFKEERLSLVENHRLRLEDKTGFYEFDLSMHNHAHSHLAGAPIANHRVSVSVKPGSNPAVRTQLGLGFGGLTYGKSRGSNDETDPTAFNFQAEARAIFAPKEASDISFEGDLRFPVVAILPGPFHFPASGAYTLTGFLSRPSWGTSTSDGTAFHLLPGFTLQGLYLEHRTDASGIYAGPEVAVSLTGEKSRLFGERAFEARAGASPLFGENRSPFFNSYGVFALLSVELFDPMFTDKDVSFETRVDYSSISSKNQSAVGMGSFSLGIRIWM
jgi:hypothetical protein